ncbi:MAG: NADH-quinone oxidoreductase subunit F [Proteobacteria bacterium]|nr:NADH-quinone oxidoreductase subunit F [Pseudomonadota bacterium]MCP4920438.1 NADH-quinone oxidoreductase subunit F [Pseudomonadota bacterium]
MKKKGARRDEVIEQVEHHGGLRPGVAEAVSAETGIPAADVYGVSTFYTLLREPNVKRVCQGLTCKMAGADSLIDTVEGVAASCLGQCDRAPVSIAEDLTLEHADTRGAITPDDDALAMNLGGQDDPAYPNLARAKELGAEAFLAELKSSGLQGRGGAGFPAWIKWNAVRNESDPTHYVIVNADEAEPGTFKDREVMLRRPHLLLEGLAIACWFAGCTDAYIYIRGEFPGPKRSVEAALAAAPIPGVTVHIVSGHGAYICGEETALIESIEGKRGMPRLKPPYPTQVGLFGKPTLMNNVETLACVPRITERGGDWFRGLGKTEAGTKLYCLSGHVQNPGVYELPLGVTLDELVEAAGGYIGTPKAFSPGGASAGFLPMANRSTPLDFKSLADAGSMIGSAGVVVLNDTISMADAARWQQIFFEDESCGQCAPCRIGARLQRRAIDKYLETRDFNALKHVVDLHWEMEEGSICGLGMVASLPLVSAMKHFPEDFS